MSRSPKCSLSFRFLISPACYMFSPSHRLSFNQPTDITYRVKTIKVYAVLFSPCAFSFLSVIHIFSLIFYSQTPSVCVLLPWGRKVERTVLLFLNSWCLYLDLFRAATILKDIYVCGIIEFSWLTRHLPAELQ